MISTKNAKNKINEIKKNKKKNTNSKMKNRYVKKKIHLQLLNFHNGTTKNRNLPMPKGTKPSLFPLNFPS